jgi:amino acid adenylation domain-containing protein/non-ribosomal peptide synthase protein (TIGR01720 family)
MSAIADSPACKEKPIEPADLVELLCIRAISSADQCAYTFLNDDGKDISITYGELDRRARMIGAWLQSRRLEGLRALLMFHPGLDFIAAYFGCIYAGVFAVPVYPLKRNRNAVRLQAVIEDARPAVGIVSGSLSDTVSAALSAVPTASGMQWVTLQQIARDGADADWRKPHVTGETVAFLQYTSGSTSLPKGVVVTHGNILHNQRLIREAFQTTSDDIVVGWLPPYHDMGLLGNILHPLYSGCRCVIMAPHAFLQRPAKWLEAISRFKGTISGGPNFAYDFCVERVSLEQRAQLELGSWRVAFNGAEPVRRETLDRFTETFSASGFQRRAFFPCYGLAEGTLMVSGGVPEAEPIVQAVRKDALELSQVVVSDGTEESSTCLVGCGRALLGQRLVIINPESLRECTVDEIGEIWVKGVSVAKGYWNRYEETSHTFHGYVKGTGEGPFLRTGDLGFLRGGELFVAGRLKDLMIVRGRNYYPHDIEWIGGQAHEALRLGGGAAFTVEIGRQERPVIVYEVNRRGNWHWPDVIETVRRAVAEEDLELAAVVLIKPGSLPRTTSGKVQRRSCRQAFIQGELSIVAEWREDDVAAPMQEAEYEKTPRLNVPGSREEHDYEWVLEEIGRVAQISRTQLDQQEPVAHYILDSLKLFQVKGAIEARYQVDTSVEDYFDRSMQALIDRLSAFKGSVRGGQLVPHPVGSGTRSTSLSYGQRALWFVQQLVPSSAAYTLSYAARLHGTLDVAALEKAWSRLVSRHEVLCSKFVTVDGSPRQHFDVTAAAGLNVEDASRWTEEELNERLQAEAGHPINLEDGPVCQARLFTRAAGTHVLFLMAHHIAVDLWSVGILMRELRLLYGEETGHGPADLPNPEWNYRHFIAWQEALVSGPDGERLKDYWQQQLAGSMLNLNLPTDRPRPSVQTYHGAVWRAEVDPDLTPRLHALSRAHGVTLYTTLLAAFQLLLSRYTGQEHFVVGSTTAGRTRAEWNEVVGYHINPVVLRGDLSGSPTFATFLKQVHRTVLGALAHQDYPFSLLVDQMRTQPDASRSPLFQVMFTWEDISVMEAGLGQFALGKPGHPLEFAKGVTWETIPLSRRAAPFDMTLMVGEVANRLALSCEYNTDLFEDATIRRMLRHFQVILEGVVTAPNRRVDELPLLTDSERRQVVMDWNATLAERPDENTLHSLVESQTLRTPDRVAVVGGGMSLTYRDLDRRANQLAHYLQKRGIGPEQRVAVCLDRSPELVIALLAVLKAGAGYVPLDPDYPSERLAYLISDAKVSALVTQASLAGLLGEWNSTVVLVDTDREAIARERGASPSTTVLPDHLAYVIYTSGSTGRPKGVAVTHGNVVHSTAARLLYYREPVRGFLLLSSIGFDSSVAGLFGALAQGGSVVLSDAASVQQRSVFCALIRDYGVTHLLTVPALYRALLQDSSDDALAGLYAVIVAGEACPNDLLRQHRRRVPGVRFFNEYGPTEATVWCTVYEACEEERSATIPIGHPITNVQVYLLDRRMEPVPIGVSGEVYVGGVGVARGYWNCAALTAERFVPDPFCVTPGGRLYRTGDMARYRSDGVIEFIGRRDEQVKIHGYRIELGEVEAVLQLNPDVRAAVAVVREERVGELRLVAYVVPAGEGTVTGRTLREYLQAHLPAGMVPSEFILLDALPLSPNGKVDRQALPLPVLISHQSYQSPSTPVEGALAEIWAQVLGLDRVGIHDNFFEIGGDSIQSMRIIAKARQAGLSLRPALLFQYPTIADLARFVERYREVESAIYLPERPTPLTPVQQWFFERNPPALHQYNQAVWLDVEPLDLSILEQAFHDVIEHHAAFRLRFEHTGSGWRQHYAQEEDATIVSAVDASGESDEAVEGILAAAVSRAHESLHLQQGPLLRAVYFTFRQGSPRLFLTAHHLVIDGVSWRILLEDLPAAYEARSRGQKAFFAGPSFAFLAWAERLEAHAQSEQVLAEREYWLGASRQPIGLLPRDRVVRTTDGEGTRVVSGSLNELDTLALIRDLAPACRASHEELVLSAVTSALAEWMGSVRVLIDLEGHGRADLFPDIDVSRAVGWFTSLYPVVFEVSKGDSSYQVLKAIKQQLRHVPHKGLGYGLLRYLQPDDEARRCVRDLPQAEISFNYLGQLDHVLTGASGWKVRDIPMMVHSPGTRRPYLLDVMGAVIDGRLTLTWLSSESEQSRTTIEWLADRTLELLRTLIQEAGSPSSQSFTASDFALAQIRESDMEKLLAEKPGITELYPLSPMQHGMLLHSLLVSGSSVYCEQLRFTLDGLLNVQVFERAWQAVVQRHAVLRTGFLLTGYTEPLQYVQGRVAVPFVFLDFRQWPPSDRTARLHSWLQMERSQPFDLATAPLMRLAVIRMADDQWCFVWTHHHALLDGWSLPLLLTEAFKLYEAFLNGRDPSLPSTRPYLDYIRWLRQQNVHEAEAFWRAELRGFTTPTPLHFGKPATLAFDQSLTHQSHEIRLSASLTTDLRSFAREHGMTLSTIIQGVWAILLSRYSGEDEVLFGVTLSGRPHELSGADAMVGLFINTLPRRIRVDGTSQVITWLKELQVRNATLLKFEHSSLAQVNAWSDLPGGTRLFESYVVFENYPIDEMLRQTFGEVRLSAAELAHESSYPLQLVVFPDQELLLKILYDPRQCESQAVERAIRHVHVLIQEIVTTPERVIDDLPLLTAAEREQLLVQWNATAGERVHDHTLVDLIGAQAARTPDAVAVVCRESVTYGELDRRANQLAHHLRRRGVRPESRVAVCLEPSIDLVVALLGTLKAGGAYVPLDPEYPTDRLALIVADAEAAVLVTQHHLRMCVPVEGMQCVCVDTDARLIAIESDMRPVPVLDPGNAAYVIYTSGSTGRPKGVVVTHANVVHSTMARLAYYREGVRSFLLLSSLAFDSSVAGLFGTLAQGGQVVLPLAGEVLEPGRLGELMDLYSVSHLLTVPSLYRVLLEQIPTGRWHSMRSVIVAGEACGSDLLVKHRHRLAGVKLCNEYGPTEATVWSTAHEGRDQESTATVPIGRPIANTQVYLLDRRLEPVPVGVPGELYIGGIGVSRGYWNRPGLTAAAFIPDLYGPEPGGRLYRTGDLARHDSDGVLEFMGRVDHQVKIRGHRIEMEEIEGALCELEVVQNAVVTVHERAGGDTRLVGYVIPRIGSQPTSATLRDALSIRLPDYMIPTTFVLLERFPLTPNGKVDRRALPDIDQVPAMVEAAQASPASPTEDRVIRIWKEVLDIDQLTVTDNFFDLGGHSLLAIQVVSRLNEVFKQELSVAALFESPTVAQLAMLIDSQPADGQQDVIGQVVDELEGLSDAEVAALLEQEPN